MPNADRGACWAWMERRFFAPTAKEILEAEEIVEAFSRPENAGCGVIRLNGRMVERLHLKMARAVLERAAVVRRMEKEGKV